MTVVTTADMLHTRVIWFFGLGPRTRKNLEDPAQVALTQARTPPSVSAYVCFVVTVAILLTPPSTAARAESCLQILAVDFRSGGLSIDP
jgi:hypothetical protein